MSEFGKWTSVKDELPPKPENHEDKSYLVTKKSRTIPYVMYWNGTSFYNSVGLRGIIEADVIAWMSLPEMYKPADPIEEIRKEVENNKSTIGILAKDFAKLLSDYKDVKEVADGIVRDMGTMNTIIGDLIRHQEEHRVEIARIKMKMEENNEE